jgi:lysophospholipase
MAPRLVDIPQAPIPPGGVVEEFQGAGGVPLRAAYFAPPGEAAGSVILSPGRTEPIEKYFEVVGELLQRGLAVVVHDWRGQGLSHRLAADYRGHGDDWRCYVRDHQLLLSAFEDRLPRPRIALTHSMGGCFVALALPEEPRIDGALFTAPMFGIALGRLPVWAAKAVTWLFCRLGRRGAYIWAGSADPLRSPFDNNVLTHDRARWQRHRAQLLACPGLKVGGVTWGWLDNALKAVAQAARPGVAAAISIHLVVLAAEDDRLVVNAAARAFAEAAPQGRYAEAPGARHEIMMETDAIRAVFWDEFDRLAARVRRPNA